MSLLSDMANYTNVSMLHRQGGDRYKYFGSPNQIQNQFRLVLLVLLVLTVTKIRYHYGKMANCVSLNQIQIQIGLVLLVRPITRDDTSQPWPPVKFMAGWLCFHATSMHRLIHVPLKFFYKSKGFTRQTCYIVLYT